MREPLQRLINNLGQVMVGKKAAIELMLVGLLAGGHVLLEDVPGVGKTLLAKALARSLAGTFQRIQATPDLLPTDLSGTNIWNPKTAEFEFRPGPVFCNILLADEINRATPRTQSALLEVMEEYQVTIDGVTYPLPQPFFVIATQNPVEYQGTFPLPEAQLDRFALCFSLGYPTEEEELQMLQRVQGGLDVNQLEPCLSLAEIQQLRQQVLQVRVDSVLQKYILALVRASRESDRITLGVSPRGTVMLQRTAQALAFLNGRDYVLPDDVKQLAPHVLAHRLITAAGRSGRACVAELLETVAVP
ncbi:MoxR family ATPase [Thermosynechococcus sp. GLH187]|uniref:AAA family ATPase n=1 Tax=unclassified Thermosynechococcus TaxID=2622553 RepID=UPI00197E7FED|nr:MULTISPECIES: MoxR family ATPase [unclassified Thermosynechococcus]QSF49704.1 MoxR family ATPase [Thermosynechococcus sp. TA-1]WNC22790.1 MoxR family ATPase [Thermosynechococcus sp. PP22]WNC45647.1 MoxR family ATPase [Thermosynechococcus sp. GLH187]WNC48183.1 MoxR family ATPase [Thermosynechococcus sp. GLH333]WNC50716.1 MoxR family ATPase [Thermosynechococcus sp. GLH87]